MRLNTSLRKKISIDITPLVDIIFILLIFFMVTSTFLELPGLKLELPAAASSRPQKVRQLVIVMSADGKIYLNEEPLTLAQLKPKLKTALAQKSTEPTLIIKADRRVPHGDVVQVMDMAKLYGIQKLIITTQLPLAKK